MKSREFGFTLVELMVVILIIGVLAGILLPAFGRVRMRGRVVKAQSEAASIMNGIKTYFLEYGEFPVSSSWLNNPKLYTNETSNATIIDRLSPQGNSRNIVLVETDGLSRENGTSGPYGVQWPDSFQPFRIRIDTRYPSATSELADGVEVSFIDYKGARVYDK